MKTKLEKYLDDHRRELDIEEPDVEAIWAGVRQEMDRRSSRGAGIWRFAAAIALIASIGMVLIWQNANRPQEEPAMTLADISEELSQQEQEYIILVNQKYDELDMYEYEPAEYAIYFDELNSLDSLNMEYVNDLSEIGQNPRLVKALLRYYENKIRLLEKLLIELEKNQRTNDEESIEI